MNAGLEGSLGRQLSERERFLFVYGTAGCQLPSSQAADGKDAASCELLLSQADQAGEAGDFNAALGQKTQRCTFNYSGLLSKLRSKLRGIVKI